MTQLEARDGRLGSQELTAEAYYAGLSPTDAERVMDFVEFIGGAGDTVMAYGSTTRPDDRDSAHDIDLKVMSSALGRDRKAAIDKIRERIRRYLSDRGERFEETEQTFRLGGNWYWDSGMGYDAQPGISGGYPVPNEDPSFQVFPVTSEGGLPLHISIAGEHKVNAGSLITAERNGDRSFAVLAE